MRKPDTSQWLIAAVLGLLFLVGFLSIADEDRIDRAAFQQPTQATAEYRNPENIKGHVYYLTDEQDWDYKRERVRGVVASRYGRGRYPCLAQAEVAKCRTE